MQTFLAFKSFTQNAKILDSKRLNKQVLECSQIYKALTLESKGYQNHPAVLMWKNKENELLLYWYFMSNEYFIRNDKKHKSKQNIVSKENLKNIKECIFDERVYISHKYNLLLKDYDYYSKIFKSYNEILFDEFKKHGNGYFWETEPKGIKAKKDKLFWENVYTKFKYF